MKIISGRSRYIGSPPAPTGGAPLGIRTRIITYIVVGLFLPVSLSVGAWWISSFLYMVKIITSHSQVIGISAGFMGAGMIINLFYLKKLAEKFFDYNIKILLIINLFWSFILIGAFGGFPVGNLVIGAVTGLYMGTRKRLKNEAISSKKISLFTALLTGGLSGLIVLFQITASVAGGGTGHIENFSQRFIYGGLLILSAILVGFVQYYITKFSFKFAFSSLKP
jgi:hypothetical protein